MTIVLQEDARRAIIADFSAWAALHLERRPGTVADSKVFFGHLRYDRQQLLEFRHPCPDKWQVVHSWLSGAGLVSD
ncbi:MAG: hypothetical protein ABIP64_19415 [Burkholderiales bacterium]